MMNEGRARFVLELRRQAAACDDDATAGDLLRRLADRVDESGLSLDDLVEAMDPTAERATAAEVNDLSPFDPSGELEYDDDRCSACGAYVGQSDDPSFCPKCGARIVTRGAVLAQDGRGTRFCAVAGRYASRVYRLQRDGDTLGIWRVDYPGCDTVELALAIADDERYAESDAITVDLTTIADTTTLTAMLTEAIGDTWSEDDATHVMEATLTAMLTEAVGDAWGEDDTAHVMEAAHDLLDGD